MYVDISYYDEQGSETNKESLTGHGFNITGEYDESKGSIVFWGAPHRDNNICPILLEHGYSMAFDYSVPYHIAEGGKRSSSLVFTCVLDDKSLLIPKKNDRRFTVDRSASFIYRKRDTENIVITGYTWVKKNVFVLDHIEFEMKKEQWNEQMVHIQNNFSIGCSKTKDELFL